MIHTNQPATDYEMGFPAFTSDSPTSNPIFAIGTTVLEFTETWGNAFAAGAMGMRITVTNTDHAPSPNTYRVQAVTPWFSYDSGSITGWDSTGAYVFRMLDAKLVVIGDCSWTLTFSGLQFWNATTMLGSCGAQTMSGAGYDERLNNSGLDPAIVQRTLPVTATCPITATIAGTWSAGCSMTGGYRFKDSSGSWIADPVNFDSSGAGGSCPCVAALPGITGADTWGVGVGVSLSGSLALGSGSVACGPVCTASFQHYATLTTAFQYLFTNALVKGRFPNLRAQTVATAWDCQSNGVATSGSSSVTSSTAQTTCSSNRGITASAQFLACLTAPLVACTAGSSCGSPPANMDCSYDGSASLTWPTALPCMAPLVNALGYDVSKFGEHCAAVAEAGTDRIVLGVAGNVLPQAWAFLDTGLTGTWARPRYQDLGTWPIGLFYGDGTNCYWSLTQDNGGTWATISMGTGVIGDFDEGSDGLRWFFKLVPGSGSTFDVWGQVLDAQLSVVRTWTVTNVTGVDEAPIACRESPGSDGSWRIGLWFSVAGTATVKFSLDGLNFS